MRDRSAHLREGRRLAHAGDHEAALRELEAGVALAPTDPTLRCEAGLQAHHLGRLDVAFDHLAQGVARAVRPHTEAACLYNLGRVLEDRGDGEGAAQCYVDSLSLRPNDVVRARLAAIEGTADEGLGDEGWDEDAALALDLDAFDREEPFATLDELCGAVSADCHSSAETHRVPPAPNRDLRELAMVQIQSDEDLADLGYLVARSDRGWRVIARVTQTDTTDTYGRLEATETAHLAFDDGAVIVQVDGDFDESVGEADAYWECEQSHPEDDDARRQCFDAAIEGLGDPEEWHQTRRFVLEGGVLVER